MVSSAHPDAALLCSLFLNLKNTTGKAGWLTEVVFHGSDLDHGASQGHSRLMLGWQHQCLWRWKWSLASADWQ